jgi:hypothetical protein
LGHRIRQSEIKFRNESKFRLTQALSTQYYSEAIFKAMIDEALEVAKGHWRNLLAERWISSRAVD